MRRLGGATFLSDVKVIGEAALTRFVRKGQRWRAGPFTCLDIFSPHRKVGKGAQSSKSDWAERLAGGLAVFIDPLPLVLRPSLTIGPGHPLPRHLREMGKLGLIRKREVRMDPKSVRHSSNFASFVGMAANPNRNSSRLEVRPSGNTATDQLSFRVESFLRVLLGVRLGPSVELSRIPFASHPDLVSLRVSTNNERGEK